MAKALLGFEPRISCLLDRHFDQLSHSATFGGGADFFGRSKTITAKQSDVKLSVNITKQFLRDADAVWGWITATTIYKSKKKRDVQTPTGKALQAGTIKRFGWVVGHYILAAVALLVECVDGKHEILRASHSTALIAGNVALSVNPTVSHCCGQTCEQ